MQDGGKMSDRIEALVAAAERRILVLDGAMGTMIQRARADRRRTFAASGLPITARPQGQQRRPRADAPRRHPRHPPPVSRGRLRHHRDEHVQRQAISQADYDLESLELRDERRGRAAGASRLPTNTRPRPGSAAIRRGIDRPDQPHFVDFARRERSGGARGDVRSGARRVSGPDPRPHRRRRRPAAVRDHHRHAECQSRARGDRGGLRGEGRQAAA